MYIFVFIGAHTCPMVLQIIQEMAMIKKEDKGTMFSKLKLAWEEKWHSAIMQFAVSQKVVNKRLKQVLDDESGYY